jgi:hypothetical protein
MNLDEELDNENVCYYTGIEGEITQNETVTVWCRKSSEDNKGLGFQ